jgi:hypothetical protein
MRIVAIFTGDMPRHGSQALLGIMPVPVAVYPMPVMAPEIIGDILPGHAAVVTGQALPFFVAVCQQAVGLAGPV